MPITAQIKDTTIRHRHGHWQGIETNMRDIRATEPCNEAKTILVQTKISRNLSRKNRSAWYHNLNKNDPRFRAPIRPNFGGQIRTA